MDIASIAAGLASLKAAGEIAKGLQELSGKLDTAEAKNQLADLRGALADLKGAVADARDEIVELREENRRLQQAMDVRSNVVSRDGYYFLLQPAQGYGQGPFCTACLDARGKLVQVQKAPRKLRYEANYRCPVCNASFMGRIAGEAPHDEEDGPAIGSITMTR